MFDWVIVVAQGHHHLDAQWFGQTLFLVPLGYLLVGMFPDRNRDFPAKIAKKINFNFKDIQKKIIEKFTKENVEL